MPRSFEYLTEIGLSEYTDQSILDRIERLQSKGIVIGPRDPNMNRAFQGEYMVTEPYEDGLVQDTAPSPQDITNQKAVLCLVGDDIVGLLIGFETMLKHRAKGVRDRAKETANHQKRLAAWETGQRKTVRLLHTKINELEQIIKDGNCVNSNYRTKENKRLQLEGRRLFKLMKQAKLLPATARVGGKPPQ